MKKILIVTSTYYFVRVFLLAHIKYMSENGWCVHIASHNDGEPVPGVHKQIDIPIKRSPFKLDNIKAVNLLREHINREKYDIVHCHTPLGAMVARLAAKEARKSHGTKVIYMTHGLHFYQGAPLKNWMLYYPAEKFMARYTDAIITINEEDRATVAKFQQIKKKYKLSGIGYDSRHIGTLDRSRREELRRQNGLAPDDFVGIYIARYTSDKNHRFLIESLPYIHSRIPQCKIIMLGDGSEMESCRQLAKKLGVEESVKIMGFKQDIGDYLIMSDVGLSPSACEGLGLGLVEEMCAKLPVLATDIRGHHDLIKDGVNGVLYPLNDRKTFIEKLCYLYSNPAERERIGNTAHNGISEYAVENIISEMMSIYDDVLT